MTYTLAMADSKGIRIAKDGVAEVSMTDARALLTSFIREVGWGGRVGAFTERGDRRVYAVKPEFYDQALINEMRVAVLVNSIDKIPEEVRDQPWARELLAVRSTIKDVGT